MAMLSSSEHFFRLHGSGRNGFYTHGHVIEMEIFFLNLMFCFVGDLPAAKLDSDRYGTSRRSNTSGMDKGGNRRA